LENHHRTIADAGFYECYWARGLIVPVPIP